MPLSKTLAYKHSVLMCLLCVGQAHQQPEAGGRGPLQSGKSGSSPGQRAAGLPPVPLSQSSLKSAQAFPSSYSPAQSTASTNTGVITSSCSLLVSDCLYSSMQLHSMLYAGC